MLILGRQIGQSFYIDKDIKIKLLSIHGKQIRVGIEAPKNINIVREELLDTRKSATASVEKPPAK